MNPANPRAASVLLITPFPDEGEMYARYLNAHGFTATVCRDSQEAIEHAMQTPPDVIVTRLRQQGHPGGLEIVDRLKACDATRHVPIVMITTSISANDRVAAHAAGCDGYVLLPLVPDALVTELRRVLATRHSAPGKSRRTDSSVAP